MQPRVAQDTYRTDDRRRMRVSAPFLFATVLLPLAAQDPPAARPRPVRIDEVVATVNDAAILRSTIVDSVRGDVNDLMQRLRRPLHQAEIQGLMARALDVEIQRHALAQSAKSFGVASPEQVEQFVKTELDRDEAERVRDFGTELAYSRELQRKSRDWQTYQREQRVEKLHGLANVTVIKGAQTTEVTGDSQKVDGLAYTDRVTGQSQHVALEGVFVQIGLLPNTDWLKGTIELSRFGEIEVDAKGQTSVPGVFAAGDCTTVPYKQIIIAMGEGAKASLAAFDHLIRA